MARQLPVIQGTGSIRTDGHRNYVHPADVRGRFATARRIVFALLLGVYVALPFVRIDGRPAVLIDVQHRRFFLFGATFNAQDFWMAFFLLTGVGLGILVLTATAGRVWCGWACPQTVFLEGVFRPIERLVQGPREKRLKRNAGPWVWDKIWRKVLTNALYALGAVLMAHVFLGYFVSLPEAVRMVRSSPAQHPEAFAWVFVTAGLLYFNFAWFREQTCVVVCPYGRLQSVLIDRDSLVVGYDKRRGEPRGHARGREREEGRGDCVDCKRCVVVCPTGIDIRNGLQLDCIACTACIDACDEVMDKLGRPRGLIRYDSQKGLAGEPRRFFRPRVALYGAVVVLWGLGAFFAFREHKSFEANVLRLPGPPYVIEEGMVRNAFEIHLVNKRGERATFEIIPEPRAGVSFVVPLRAVSLAAMSSAHVPVFVTIPREEFHGDFEVRLRVRALGGSETRVIAPFLGPARAEHDAQPEH